jgi:flavin-dependent dehydrogenase
MTDVLIVGAGPAGAVAGLVLARAGARVTILDRADFPRDKLCGDTINPGTLAHLRRLGVADDIEARGLRIRGMLVTGEHGDAVVGAYPHDLAGVAIVRRELDAMLLRRAIAAGCAFEPRVAARRAILAGGGARGSRVAGVAVDAPGGRRDLTAPVVIAADGRRSTLAFALGLARHPAHPRRWAIGAYFADADGPPAPTLPVGEMHVRTGRYIGVAPLPDGITNVCLVTPSHAADTQLHDPAAAIAAALGADAQLRRRFAHARLVTTPVVLGPLAVEPSAQAIDGLLLAGDAAGFVDPMTGDGLRFAIRGAELAAAAALRALEHGWTGVHESLARARSDEFAGKIRFNRALRALVASPRAVSAAAVASRIVPTLLRGIVRHAGDCGMARRLAVA